MSPYKREIENLQQKLQSGSPVWKVRWDKDKVEELEQRIAKAREILQEHRNAHAVGWGYGKRLTDWCNKRDAWLDTLEGK